MNKFISPILFIMCLFVTACSDDNNENEPIIPFNLDKTYYEVRLERSATCISITNGSGDISLAIEDENILEAIYVRYNNDWEKDYGQKGHINLYGLQKGSTTLIITDNITKEKEAVEVKVTDCYLAYAIADSNHPVLEAGTVLFWVNNQSRDCYLFAKDNMHGQLYSQPLVKGSYDFFVSIDSGTGPSPQLYGIPYLRLTYPSDNEGNLASSNIAATPHDFQIEIWGENVSSSYVLQVIQAYLGVDWGELTGNAQAKSPVPVDMTMIMTVPGTDYQIRGILSTTIIPEHILE